MANNDDGGQKWAEEIVKTFGATAKRVRGKRSAKWLSDRTAELGYRVSPTVISKLDTGHRGSVLHLPEILVIAQALDVSPIGLIFGRLPDGPFEVTPGNSRRSLDVFAWFAGDQTSPSDAGVTDRIVASSRRLIDAEQQQEDVARLAAAEIRYLDMAARLDAEKAAGVSDVERARYEAESAIAAEQYARTRQVVESRRFAYETIRSGLKDLGAEVHDG
ncbi:hypothetical protein [Gordonia sp. (in: high G+C Gram-positive bacteria)]|uniref:hypothetical protein n=1 Tax=Gordonia sp. (in: high G+C Gram-positive bacteria) TaxID=84139 RepID=UPI003341A612